MYQLIWALLIFCRQASQDRFSFVEVDGARNAVRLLAVPVQADEEPSVLRRVTQLRTDGGEGETGALQAWRRRTQTGLQAVHQLWLETRFLVRRLAGRNFYYASLQQICWFLVGYLADELHVISLVIDITAVGLFVHID